jgi:hypothetical protein
MMSGTSAIGALRRQWTLRHQTQSHGAACRIWASVGRGAFGRLGITPSLACIGH